MAKSRSRRSKTSRSKGIPQYILYILLIGIILVAIDFLVFPVTHLRYYLTGRQAKLQLTPSLSSLDQSNVDPGLHRDLNSAKTLPLKSHSHPQLTPELNKGHQHNNEHRDPAGENQQQSSNPSIGANSSSVANDPIRSVNNDDNANNSESSSKSGNSKSLIGDINSNEGTDSTRQNEAETIGDDKTGTKTSDNFEQSALAQSDPPAIPIASADSITQDFNMYDIDVAQHRAKIGPPVVSSVIGEKQNLTERGRKAPVNAPGFILPIGCEGGVEKCFRFIDGKKSGNDYWLLDDLAAVALAEGAEPFKMQATPEFMRDVFEFMLVFQPWRRQCNIRKHYSNLPECTPPAKHLFRIGAPDYMLGQYPKGGPLQFSSHFQCDLGYCLVADRHDWPVWKIGDKKCWRDGFIDWVPMPQSDCGDYTFCHSHNGEAVRSKPPRPWELIRDFVLPVEDPHFDLLNWWPPMMFRWEPIPFEQKHDIMFLSSNCQGRDREARVKFVQNLIKRGLKIKSFGKCAHNADMNMFPDCNVVQDDKKLELVGNGLITCLHAHFKFVIVAENSAFYHYVTEKVYMPLAVGAVPLYWGSKFVLDVAPTRDAVVHVPEKFNNNIDKLTTWLHEHVSNKAKYKKLLEWRKRPWQQSFKQAVSKSGFLNFCNLCDDMYTYWDPKQVQDERGCKKQETIHWPKEAQNWTAFKAPYQADKERDTWFYGL